MTLGVIMRFYRRVARVVADEGTAGLCRRVQSKVCQIRWDADFREELSKSIIALSERSRRG